MLRPNWFDLAFAKSTGTAEQVLAEIAVRPEIVAAVAHALADYDASCVNCRFGPSRTQVIRQALIEVLSKEG